MDLPEGSTVQDQNSFVGGGHDQFRLRRIAHHAHRHCYQRRRRQISAHQKLPEEYATQIVLGEPSGASDIKPVIQTGEL